jgi:hypothetical protein
MSSLDVVSATLLAATLFSFLEELFVHPCPVVPAMFPLEQYKDGIRDRSVAQLSITSSTKHEVGQREYELLQTIPGIAAETAAVILAETGGNMVHPNLLVIPFRTELIRCAA